jgi:hypothetical protein
MEYSGAGSGAEATSLPSGCGWGFRGTGGSAGGRNHLQSGTMRCRETRMMPGKS